MKTSSDVQSLRALREDMQKNMERATKCYINPLPSYLLNMLLVLLFLTAGTITLFYAVKEGTLLFNAQSSVFDMSETVPVIVQCACAMLNAMLLSWAFDRLLHTEDILAHDIKATAALIEELDEMIAEKEHGSAESKSAKPGKEDPRC